ncbi:MAG TPA: DUF4142 domain-containing protein [Flavitalea sp.]|nr:DUF4142 domain-containing protein [Flavitalea sp.]
MKIISWISLVLVVAAGIFSACNKDENSDNVYNVSDSIFVLKASMSNFTEITLGQIASDSSTDPAVAQYGARMVLDHTNAQQQLQSVAGKLGMTISNSLDQQHQLLRDSLLTYKGFAFDSIYIHSQVRDHQETIHFFKNESAHGMQKEVRAYMYQVLPALNMHLQSAIGLSYQY